MATRTKRPIEPLLAFIDAQEDHLATADFHPTSDNLHEFNVVLAVCAQAVRYAAAYATLYRAGRPREAVVLSRQALEHAVTAQWAHYTAGGVDMLSATLKQTQVDFHRKMAEWLGNQPLADAVEELAADLGEIGSDLPSVTNRFKPFHELLRITYMEQSQFTHVTSTSALGLLGADGNRLVLRPDATDPFPENTAYTTAMAAMFAMWLLRTLTGDTHALAELDLESDRLELPVNVAD